MKHDERLKLISPMTRIDPQNGEPWRNQWREKTRENHSTDGNLKLSEWKKREGKKLQAKRHDYSPLVAALVVDISGTAFSVH